KPDIAAVHKYFTYFVTVMINLTSPGDTTFSYGPRTNFDAGPRAQTLVAGDLNGDGKTDLLAAANSGVGLFIPLLNATPNNAATPVFTSVGGIGGIGGVGGANMVGAIADVNGDGRMDLVGYMTSGSVNEIVMQLNTTPAGAPTMQFAPVQTIITSVQTAGIAVADVNGDGKPDF